MFTCLSPEGIQGWKVIFLAEHAAFPKSAWLAFHGARGRYKNLAPECVRTLVPGRGQLESGVPGRAGERQTGHVLEQNAILAIQGNCFWKMAMQAFHTPGKTRPFCEETLRLQTGFSEPQATGERPQGSPTLGSKSKAELKGPPNPIANGVASTFKGRGERRDFL